MEEMHNWNITAEEEKYGYQLLRRTFIFFYVTILAMHIPFIFNPIENIRPTDALILIATLVVSFASCLWAAQQKKFSTLFKFTFIALPIFAISATIIYGKLAQVPVVLAIYICLLGTLYLPKKIKYGAITFIFLNFLASLYPFISDHSPLIKIGPTHSYIVFIGCIITFCHILYLYQIEHIRKTTLLMMKEQEKSHHQDSSPSPDVIRLISHELRAPVANYNNIGKKISYLLENNDTVRLTNLAKELQSSGEDIQKLMDGMISIASDDINKPPINLVPVDIEQEVRSVVSAFQKTAYSKSVQINIDSDGNTLVTSEHNRLRILFSNFIDNALKFSDSDTAIHIIISTSDSEVNWVITNTGRGFSKDQIESFDQGGFILSTPGTKGELGYGIGLVSARQIAQSINVDITLSSKANTSTVSLSIPKIKVEV